MTPEERIAALGRRIVKTADDIITAQDAGAYAAAHEYREELVWLYQQLFEARRRVGL